MSRKENKYEPIIPVIQLTDEKGRDINFDHVMTFKYLENTFVALLPLDEVEEIGEDEVLLLQIDKNEPGNYLTIENEVMLEEIFEVFMELYADSLADEELEAESDENLADLAGLYAQDDAEDK